MCTYSMIQREVTNPQSPNYIHWTPQWPTPDVAWQLLEIFKRLDAIDKSLKLKDCMVKAKDKRAFKRKLETRASK